MWFMLFLAVAMALHFFVPASHVFALAWGYWGTITGMFVFLAGFYLPLWASKIFKEENTEILPNSPSNRVLVIRGPYRFSRNPMYLGMVISLIGIAIMFGTLPLFVAALAHFLVMHFVFIPFEEAKMLRQFGESYESYKHRVRRWL